MKNTYELKNIETSDGIIEILEMTDSNNVVSTVPMVAGNADYEAYLNPAEQSTPNLAANAD
jgi:hypothetical protein